MKHNILAIETSTELCSVTILYKKKMYTKYIFSKQKKNKYILILINYVISKYNININHINKIIINKGPGSIISIRITKIIVYLFKIKFTKIKIIKTTSFDIMARNFFSKNPQKNLIILIEKNSKNIYFCKYKNKKKKNIKIINLINIKQKIHKYTKYYNIIVNTYQFKKKIINLFKKKKITKKIKIFYPKAKYMFKS